MKNTNIAAFAACVCAIATYTTPAQAADTSKIIEYPPLQLRSGVLVLREWQDDKHYGDKDLVLKANGKPKKILKLTEGLAYSLVGPYQLGENDVVGVSESSGGTATGDASTITILTIDKTGNINPSRLDGKDAQQVTFDCDGLEEAATVVSTTAIKFKCDSREGRKTKSTFFTFENGRIKASRQ